MKDKTNYNIEINKIHPNILITDNDVFFNIKNKVNYKCNICNNEYYHTIRTIIKNGCPFCNNIHNHSLSNYEFDAKLKERTNGVYSRIEDYSNMTTKIKFKCNIHDNIFIASPLHALESKGCKCCASDKIKTSSCKNRKSIEEVKDIIKELWGNEFVLLDDSYTNNNTKLKFLHNTDTPHIFYRSFNSISKKSSVGCGVCKGLQICVGYNDLNTTNPDLSKCLLNYEDGFKYTENSSKKINWKCPICNNIIYDKKISDINKYGISCIFCSSGISYPNKIMNALLKEILNDDFIREFRPDWCKFNIGEKTKYGIYDFYFEYCNRKYIVEMDGGIGHGHKTIIKQDDGIEQSIFIDNQKDLLAKEHNIKVIRIDCNYPRIENRFEYIKNNILKSELSNIVCLDDVDFNKLNHMAENSSIIDYAKSWNDGLSIGEISQLTNTHYSVVTDYLKRATDLGLCNYNKNESKKRGNCHKVICEQTDIIYDSIIDASKSTGINVSTISKNCRKVDKTGGKDIYGNKLTWRYYSKGA